MFKASHATLIAISGIVWLLIGSWLFLLGLNFLVESILVGNAHFKKPFIDAVSFLTNGAEAAALVLVLISLCVGYLKGRFIFSKTVNKSVERILTLPNPVSLSQIYTKKYYILLASMMLLGFIVRFTTYDIRGTIDMIIGTALILGACLYFKQAYRVYRVGQTA